MFYDKGWLTEWQFAPAAERSLKEKILGSGFQSAFRT
jgi:hypothetical protein